MRTACIANLLLSGAWCSSMASGARQLQVKPQDDSKTRHHSDGHHDSHHVGSQSDNARLAVDVFVDQDDSKISNDGQHGRHHVGSQSDNARFEKAAEIFLDEDRFRNMRKSEMWAKIEEVEKMVESYKGKHKEKIEQAREEKTRWSKDWEKCQRDGKKLRAMRTKVQQLKLIVIGGSHSEDVHLESKSGIRVNEEDFKAMSKSAQWAKIEDVEKMVESYKGKHKEKIEQAREEKTQWSKDWEKCQRDGKKLRAMRTKVRQLKLIVSGGSHSEDVHLESKSGIRVNEENFKAMSKSGQWAKIEEVEAMVESFRAKHEKHLEKVREEKKHWLEEAEKLQQHFEKLNDMRFKLRRVKQLSYS